MELKDAVCRNCPFGKSTTGRGGQEVQCRRSPEYLPKHWSDWCGEHPLRQRDRLADIALCHAAAFHDPEDPDPKSLAAGAYAVADAMLELRAGARHA